MTSRSLLPVLLSSVAVAMTAASSASAACVGDLNNDGQVDGADLGAMLASWGGAGSADLNGDGTVDGADLGAMLASWGQCAPMLTITSVQPRSLVAGDQVVIHGSGFPDDPDDMCIRILANDGSGASFRISAIESGPNQVIGVLLDGPEAIFDGVLVLEVGAGDTFIPVGQPATLTLAEPGAWAWQPTGGRKTMAPQAIQALPNGGGGVGCPPSATYYGTVVNGELVFTIPASPVPCPPNAKLFFYFHGVVLDVGGTVLNAFTMEQHWNAFTNGQLTLTQCMSALCQELQTVFFDFTLANNGTGLFLGCNTQVVGTDIVLTLSPPGAGLGNTFVTTMTPYFQICP